MRVLHGLLALAGKHPVAALEKAAEKALHHGTLARGSAPNHSSRQTPRMLP
jgi:hypothetical protein